MVRFPNTAELLHTHGYGPLSLDTIQQVAYTDAVTVAAAIHDELGRVSRAVTPFEELVRRLQDVLANTGANTLEESVAEEAERRACAVDYCADGP